MVDRANMTIASNAPTRRTLYRTVTSVALIGLATPAWAQTSANDGQDEIIVTARQREESLMSVPVAVTALSGADIARYNSDDLTKIGELTPTVVVSNYGLNGGGSLSIRGISSPATQVGFEQAVSVVLDGIQLSNGRLAQLGYFDIKQVQVMKGPQALFFGKNSPAGVISIASADPARDFEGGVTARYEFVGNEKVIEGHVSVPVDPGLGIRLAVRYRDLDGWIRNNAKPIANPFSPAYPLPGASDDRPGNKALTGRLTIKYEPNSSFDATLKAMGDRYRGNPAGGTQNIGYCFDGKPRFNGVVDPNGECVADRNVANSDVQPAFAHAMPGVKGDGKPFNNIDTGMVSLIANYKSDKFTLTSNTGYIAWSSDYFSSFDATSYAQLAVAEFDTFHAFNQELRALSKFDGPFNMMVGAYYQETGENVHSPIKFSDLGFNPVTGAYTGYNKYASLDGTTLSVFGQGILTLGDFEIAGGARWTREKKDMRMQNRYGSGGFDTGSFVYADSIDKTPGILAGKFKDSNVSPEATISYHPMPDSTLYVAYKTGYKSGGFGVTNPQSVTTTLASVSFGPENVKGFEAGFKGSFLNRKLRVELVAYSYNYKDLQVATYNPTLVAYVVTNAGEARQRGAELQADFQATENFKVRGAIAYNHNRFHNFVGQCYNYAFPTGATRATAVPPPNCSFVNSTSLTLQQDFEGRAPARSPDWSGNAGFQYDLPIGDGGITLNGDAVYSSGYYAAETMSPYSYQNSYWKLNSSIRYTAPSGKWDISLIGRNLTNKYILLFAGDRTGGASVPGLIGEQRGVVDRGREVTLQASVRF
ncbi:TonB-dependent receptor [soil metagenome]